MHLISAQYSASQISSKINEVQKLIGAKKKVHRPAMFCVPDDLES